MSAFNSEKLLKLRGAISDAPMLIHEDRFCPACDYNLKGLYVGGKCPECGRTIAVASKQPMWLMGDAPASYLRWLWKALFFQSACGTLLFVAMLAFTVAGSVLSQVPAMVAWCVLSLCWLASLVGVLKPRPRPPRTDVQSTRVKPEWAVLRWTVGASQACWIGISPIAMAAATTGPPYLQYVAAGLACIATLGLAPLSWLLSEYAHWASDTSLARRFESLAWVLCTGLAIQLFIIVISATGMGVGTFLTAFIWLIAAVWILSIFLLQFSTLQLSNDARWAITNAKEAQERDLRMTERARRVREEAAADVNKAPPPPIDLQLLEQVVTRHEQLDPAIETQQEQLGKKHTKIIDETHDDPYKLAD